MLPTRAGCACLLWVQSIHRSWLERSVLLQTAGCQCLTSRRLQLLLDCFPEQQPALLAQLSQHPDQQFVFLKSLLAIQHEQVLVHGGASPGDPNGLLLKVRSATAARHWCKRSAQRILCAVCRPAAARLHWQRCLATWAWQTCTSSCCASTIHALVRHRTRTSAAADVP